MISIHYEASMLASNLYLLLCMALIFTSKILISISKQISSGNVARGILIANEYLSPKDPVRMALLGKSESKMSSKISSHPAWIKIKEGALFSQLSSEEQMILSFESSAALPKKHLVPDFSNRRFARNNTDKKNLRPISKIRRWAVNI